MRMYLRLKVFFVKNTIVFILITISSQLAPIFNEFAYLQKDTMVATLLVDYLLTLRRMGIAVTSFFTNYNAFSSDKYKEERKK